MNCFGTRNAKVSGGKRYARERAAPCISKRGTVRLLIVALDYEKTKKTLSAVVDGKNMEELARHCNDVDVYSMYNGECTRKGVIDNIRRVAELCEDDDYFVFYFAGHGINVKDTSGDELDGQDEAFVLVDNDGKISKESLLIDDEFADILLTSTRESVRILVLTDCCHSGTVADLHKQSWNGREALSIAGCMDDQTSADTGRGGVFTHSILMALERLTNIGQSDFSCGMMYNAAVEANEVVFRSAQDITIQTTHRVLPAEMAWPLLPNKGYKAPAIKEDTYDYAAHSGAEALAMIDDALYISIVMGEDFKMCRACSRGDCTLS
mmetsp:Transcript_116/g.390  ORF Transcript_116/g.390 Transcript_116/m.390 type:complete len:323 (-) Transcript_116:205-1173(-)|eukprot:CAMPEP_0194515552 /NCGR_PEP_ID=MMETSP0253-20130528/48269_1 /TAXON_ID=2966 /ORGANISM="Noctiluca scintillans" /LENGTH=322 /DNA_ID=CAMNT_0039359319 /DNA_START=42 /DNA_END=1010 /DNA_ORIENTATION=-